MPHTTEKIFAVYYMLVMFIGLLAPMVMAIPASWPSAEERRQAIKDALNNAKCKNPRWWQEEVGLGLYNLGDPYSDPQYGLQVFEWINDYGDVSSGGFINEDVLLGLKAMVEAGKRHFPGEGDRKCVPPMNLEDLEGEERTTEKISIIVYCKNGYSVRIFNERDRDGIEYRKLYSAIDVWCGGVAMKIAEEAVTCLSPGPDSGSVEDIQQLGRPHRSTEDTINYRAYAVSFWSQDHYWGVVLGREKKGCPAPNN